MHPLTNAEIARLAHADAIRAARHVPAPEAEERLEARPVPDSLARLVSRLLPELPIPRPAAPTRR